jgi:hypothetical protein
MRKIILILIVILMLLVVVLLMVRGGNSGDPSVIDESLDNLVQPPSNTTLFDGQAITLIDSDVKINDSFTQFYTESEYDGSFGKFSGLGQKNVFSALRAKIQPSLQPLLDQEQWDLYRCQSVGGSYVPMAISLTLSANQTFTGNLYTKTRTEMAKWEQTMGSDLAPILFPDQLNVAEYVPQQMTFFDDYSISSADVRTATIFLSDGAAAELGYLMIGSDIIVSNNVSCLQEAQRKIFDLNA